MNILTFDIEEWYIEQAYNGGRISRYQEFDRVLNMLLDLLEHNNLSATFFCLGKIASNFPNVVKLIASKGHEIGSHSHEHHWVNKMTHTEFSVDTHNAVSSLEDLTGTKVRSFRAPAFSIGEQCKWALEILAENGIENDASIFPGVRDFGGFPNFSEQQPCIIDHNGIRINEFPIPLYHLPILGKEIAYSGGGYFRLLPLSFVESRIKCSSYSMCYFHILDLMSQKSKFMTRQEYEEYFKESGTLVHRASRYFKSNVGRGRAMANLSHLLESYPFDSIRGYLNSNSINTVVSI